VIAARLTQHFNDLHIVKKPNEPELLSLFRILTSIAAQNKADNIPPNLGGDIMRSIIEGFPYPATLLTLAVQRCRLSRM
jgi:CRISPR-associated protein Csd1